MPGENETVSKEAHDRMVKERDDWKAKAEERQTLLDKAEGTIQGVQRERAVARALKDKVEDPDAVAELLAPHLADVEPDKVPETIESDEFQSRLAPFKTVAAGGEGDGEEDGEGGEPSGQPATEPGPGAFGGPSPGNDSGSQPPTGGQEPVTVGTDEWHQLLRNPDEYAKAEKEGRIVQPTPAYR